MAILLMYLVCSNLTKAKNKQKPLTLFFLPSLPLPRSPVLGAQGDQHLEDGCFGAASAQAAKTTKTRAALSGPVTLCYTVLRCVSMMVLA